MPLVFILNITTDNQQYVYLKKKKCGTDKNANVTNENIELTKMRMSQMRKNSHF